MLSSLSLLNSSCSDKFHTSQMHLNVGFGVPRSGGEVEGAHSSVGAGGPFPGCVPPLRARIAAQTDRPTDRGRPRVLIARAMLASGEWREARIFLVGGRGGIISQGESVRGSARAEPGRAPPGQRPLPRAGAWPVDGRVGRAGRRADLTAAGWRGRWPLQRPRPPGSAAARVESLKGRPEEGRTIPRALRAF